MLPLLRNILATKQETVSPCKIERRANSLLRCPKKPDAPEPHRFGPVSYGFLTRKDGHAFISGAVAGGLKLKIRPSTAGLQNDPEGSLLPGPIGLRCGHAGSLVSPSDKSLAQINKTQPGKPRLRHHDGRRR